mmetsp:Transcript_12919/g.14828  ORF Transcript_12919/g.14828 Transcript_12919/m.14828 type:complete len:221 (+) Transcript_12919:48-710(+)
MSHLFPCSYEISRLNQLETRYQYQPTQYKPAIQSIQYSQMPSLLQKESLYSLAPRLPSSNFLNGCGNLLQVPVLPQRTNENDTVLQLTLQNEKLQQQVKSLLADKAEMAEKLEAMEQILKRTPTQTISVYDLITRKKRHRRTAREINREYCCPVKSCRKSYGLESSLYQHIRLKHPDLNLAKWTDAQIKEQNSDTTGENGTLEDIKKLDEISDNIVIKSE